MQGAVCRAFTVINPFGVGMDEFQRRRERIDRQAIQTYLENLAAPCYESALLKIAFPGIMISDEEPLELYQHHFLLFHLLYKLQERYSSQNRYLHIHFMRIFLLDLPAPDQCRYFEEQIMQFCRAPCVENEVFCEFHCNQNEYNALETLSLKYFYMDARNYYNLDGDSAKKFINGAWDILNHYKDFKQSYDVLGLPRSADLDAIRRRFRSLAKKHHPDHGGRDNEKFMQINNAYRLLVRMLSTFDM